VKDQFGGLLSGGFLSGIRSTVYYGSVIPRLRDQANIEQSSSKHPANAFKIHVHDV